LTALDSLTLGMARLPTEAVHLKVHISMNSHPGKPVNNADVHGLVIITGLRADK